jgi:hypothetical protein
MHAVALSTLLLGAIEVERHRRESSGKWIVRADEGTTAAIMEDATDNAKPKARAIDIDSFPRSARHSDSTSMRLGQSGLNGAALFRQDRHPEPPINIDTDFDTDTSTGRSCCNSSHCCCSRPHRRPPLRLRRRRRPRHVPDNIVRDNRRPDGQGGPRLGDRGGRQSGGSDALARHTLRHGNVRRLRREQPAHRRHRHESLRRLRHLDAPRHHLEPNSRPPEWPLQTRSDRTEAWHPPDIGVPRAADGFQAAMAFSSEAAPSATSTRCENALRMARPLDLDQT